MQPSTSTITAPRARKGLATALAVVAAAGVGVGLAVVTSNDDSTPQVSQQQVTPPVSSLPQGNEGKLGAQPSLYTVQGNEGRAVAPSTQSSSPISDRFHRFQGGSR